MPITESDLTEEQKGGIAAAVAWGRRALRGEGPMVFKVNGPAGSGKSELARFVAGELGVLEDGLAPLGPTGMAAQVMRRKGLPLATTVHGGIYTPAKDAAEEAAEIREAISALRGSLRGRPSGEREDVLERIAVLEQDLKEVRRREKDDLEWVVNHHGPVANCRMVVCDEASMVGGQLMRDLESFGKPILYLGDQFQLPSISEGRSVFFDEWGQPLPVDFGLTQIHRQAEGSAIVRYSRDIRLNQNGAGLGFFGKVRGEDGGLLIRVPAGKLGVEHLAAAGQVICGFNKTRVGVNLDVRDHLGLGSSPYPQAGDKLVCLKNHKDYGLVNGSIGRAKSAYSDFDGRNQSFAVDVELDDGRELPGLRMLVPYFQYPGEPHHLDEVPHWAKKRFAHFDYGYALTCHKAQGTQHRGGVVIEEPFGRSDVMRRRWRYTAATRFVLNLVIEAEG